MIFSLCGRYQIDGAKAWATGLDFEKGREAPTNEPLAKLKWQQPKAENFRGRKNFDFRAFEKNQKEF